MALFRKPILKSWQVTAILGGLLCLVLMLSVPASLRDAYDRGGFYLFSQAFIDDIPKRLIGPGRFRFVLQPLIAIILGIRGGRADQKAGRPPYLYGMIFHQGSRRELLTSLFASVANLILMGILMDSIFQWFILGISYPGAALVVGPVLIVAPYSIARALSNRLSHSDRNS